MVVLSGKAQFEKISKSDLLKHELQIKLSDPSFKIIGFLASYDCHSRSISFDINIKEYQGNKIKINDSFIKYIWVGDYLEFSCINIEKNGKRFIVPEIYFKVTD